MHASEISARILSHGQTAARVSQELLDRGLRPLTAEALGLIAALFGEEGAQHLVDDYAVIAQHYEIRHPMDFMFNEGASVTVPASSTGTTVLTYTVPQGFLGILKAFATGVAVLTDFDNLTWHLSVAEQPIPGFESFLGPISNIYFPIDIRWPLPQGATVTLTADNAVAVPITRVTGMLRGAIFPCRLLTERA